MVDRDIALEALGTLCNADVTSVQKQGSRAQLQGGAVRQQLLIRHFIPTVLDADETSQVSRSYFNYLKTLLPRDEVGAGLVKLNLQDEASDEATVKYHIIDEDEFFDQRFDCDFTTLTDTDVYYRGGEVYERPCGWYRFALKVLNKYDENKWLGNQYRTTQSVPGEWPVSYHGTSKRGAEGIIEGYYKPGPRQVYGRGVYSTPYITEAIKYAKTFVSNKNGKRYQVILQNRVNPKYRQIHNKEKYWLVPIPAGISDKEEQEMVQRAIRPYGLLLKEV